MSFSICISNYIIPVVILFIVVYGLAKKVDIFSAFTKGATEGFKLVLEILPTLLGLFIAIGLARTSGVLDFISACFSPLSDILHIPSEIIPVAIVKMFSSSASTGLLLDIYKTYGPDSYIGTIVSIMMCCTETIFYTVSIYCMSIGVKKSRWTIPGALLASVAGIIASVILANVILHG